MALEVYGQEPTTKVTRFKLIKNGDNLQLVTTTPSGTVQWSVLNIFEDENGKISIERIGFLPSDIFNTGSYGPGKVVVR